MKKTKSRVILITGNEDLRNKILFTENLLYQKMLQDQKPLLISRLDDESLFSYNQEKKGQNERDFIRYFTDLHIPVITLKDMYKESNKRKKATLVAMQGKTTDIFLLGQFDQEHMYLNNYIDYFLLIIRNNFESSSYLYSFIEKMEEKNISKPKYILISDTRNIEDGALFFSRLQDEMKELIARSIKLYFCGSIFFDIRKIIFAKERNDIYIKIFNQDRFHGNIKYISEKLNSLQCTRQADDLFKKMAAL